MTRISLIVPVGPAGSFEPETVARAREALRVEGAEVEVLVVGPPGFEPWHADPDDGSWVGWTADRHGLAAAALTGLVQAGGDVRIVFDPTQGYAPEDLPRLLGPIRAGTADLVVARREGGAVPVGRWWRRSGGRLLGGFSRLALGASDPQSGLVALTRDRAEDLAGRFDPVGARFAIDLLLRAGGRRAEVPVRASGVPTRPSLSLNDLRHVKRLADDHYGNVSRLLQFCVVGASGMVVDLTSYALFQFVLARTPLAEQTAPVLRSPLDLAVAAALAIGLALTWNFTLNRRLTFNYARGGSVLHQFLVYALSNALGIALSFTLRLYLPAHVGFFGRHRLAAAVVGIVAATGISFSMARWVVFRKAAEPASEADGSAPQAGARASRRAVPTETARA